MFFHFKYKEPFQSNKVKGLTISALDEYEMIKRIRTHQILPENVLEWHSSYGKDNHVQRSVNELEYYYNIVNNLNKDGIK